jgi:hypothetical protein
MNLLPATETSEAVAGMSEVLSEKTIGPCGGYYLALYAAPAPRPERGFVGYCKVCTSPPLSYWEASCCAKVSGTLAASERRAMRLAEARGLALILGWIKLLSAETGSQTACELVGSDR